MKFILHYSNMPVFTVAEHAEKGLGGTENFACYVSKFLQYEGHEVSFYNHTNIEPTMINNIKWANLSYFDPSEPADVLISFRMREVFNDHLAAKLKVLILADTESAGLGDYVRTSKIDVVMAVSKWQMDKIAQEEDLVNHPCWMLGSNGIDADEFAGYNPHNKVKGMCIHYSTPERGLTHLLSVWPHIERKAREYTNVQPTLELFSSFRGWGTNEEDNENMCRELYEEIERLKVAGYSINNHKHSGANVLRQYQLRADLFLYPTNFNETYCISLTEAMAAGIVPIVSPRAAMGERLVDSISGYYAGDRATPDITYPENQAQFIAATVTALWLSDNVKNSMRRAARETAMKHSYAIIVPEWVREWERRIG